MDEEQEVKVLTEDCPACKKRKSFITYADGHKHCMKCHFEAGTARPKEGPTATPTSSDKRLVQPNHQSFIRLDTWRLEEKTLRKFGYFVGPYSGEMLQVSPLHDFEGTIVAQQLFPREGRKFILAGGGGKVPNDKLWLIGRHAYGDRYDRKVIVCQTPKDAMAIAQVTNFRAAASVSIISELADAEKDVKANYIWLDRFQEIIIWFEPTEEGLRKAQECALVFKAGKVKFAKMEGYSGPAEALRANVPGDIESAIWGANTYRPKGIVNASEGRDMFESDGGLMVPMWPYPFPNLQARTLGSRLGEVTYHIGGTGASKTTVLYQLAVHWATLPLEPPKPKRDYPAQMEGPKVGWLGFEDTVRSVKIGLMSAFHKQRLALKSLPKEEVLAIHDALFGPGRIELYDPESAEYSMEAIMGYIRYMAKALGCKIVVVDPLTFIIAGMSLADNERRAIDKVSQELAGMAKSLGISIHVSYHLNRPDGTPHEEGARITINHIKGSGGLAHFASNIFAYERDQLGERSDLMRVPTLKVRLTGFTGANHEGYRDHQVLQYDPEAGTYEVTDEPWPVKDDKGSKGSGGGFRNAGGSDY